MKTWIKSLAVLGLFLAAFPAIWAQGGYISGVVTNSQGRPVGGALIAICQIGATIGTTNTPCSPLATVYNDQTLLSTAVNPLAADGLGNYQNLWVAPGVYDIQFYGPTVNVTMQLLIVNCLPGGTGCGAGSSLLGTANTWTLLQTFGSGITGTGDTGTLHAGSGILGIPNTWTAAQTFSNGLNVTGGALNVSTSTTSASYNNVIEVDRQTGTTIDAKINSCMAALASGGGTCDARGFGANPQTWAAPVSLGSASKTVTLLMDKATPVTFVSTGGGCQLGINGGSSIYEVGEDETLGGQPGGFFLANTASISNVLCILNQTVGAGFSIENVTIKGNSSATISDSVVGLVNPLQVGTVRGLVIGGFTGTNLLKITSASGGSAGPINVYNPELDCGAISGCQPLLIQGAVPSGSIGGINFYGGTYVHAGTGLPIVDVEAAGGGGSGQYGGGANFYGLYLESSFSNTIGLLANNVHGVHVYGCFASATTPGADVIHIQGSSTDGIYIEGCDNFNGWTNNINNQSMSTPDVLPSSGGHQFSYEYDLGLHTRSHTWDDTLGTNGQIDSNGFSTKQVNLSGHLNQGVVKDFAGTCSMSSSTTCTITLVAAYSGTPGCVATVESATPLYAGCTVSGTTVTITANSSNSSTWAAMLFGNPN